jgi:hypothetical protein
MNVFWPSLNHADDIRSLRSSLYRLTVVPYGNNGRAISSSAWPLSEVNESDSSTESLSDSGRYQ